MFLVGGGIVVHEYCAAAIRRYMLHSRSAVVAAICPTLINLVLGFIVGSIVVATVKAC